MNRNDRIMTICADIDRFFDDFDKISGTDIPKENDPIRFHGISMVLFTILNLSFELGEEIIGYLHAGLPQTYRDIFQILKNRNLISSEIQDSMSSMVYYRNRLAHQYAGLNSEDLEIIIHNLDDVRTFIHLMKEFYKKNK